MSKAMSLLMEDGIKAGNTIHMYSVGAIDAGLTGSGLVAVALLPAFDLAR